MQDRDAATGALTLDPQRARGFASAMKPLPPESRVPQGRWPLLYASCCLLALLVMALLYWFTAHFNVRMGS